MRRPGGALDTTLRVLVLLDAILGPPAAAFTALVAWTEYRGCFDCPHELGTGHHAKGTLLYALAVGLLVGAPVLAAVGMRNLRWTLVTAVVPTLVLLFLGLAALAG